MRITLQFLLLVWCSWVACGQNLVLIGGGLDEDNADVFEKIVELAVCMKVSCLPGVGGPKRQFATTDNLFWYGTRAG